ncbi:hypothetical protein C1M53_01625 [Mesorhizobium sp. Pch-S]|nr:hypothetical protein C1M53_01625 [Mesorhizobium sp. Pch-S]
MRPELRENKEVECFRVSVKNGNALVANAAFVSPDTPVRADVVASGCARNGPGKIMGRGGSCPSRRRRCG